MCCGNAVISPVNNLSKVNNKSKVNKVYVDCDYTDDILKIWVDKLKWFKNKGLYIKHNVPASTVNKYLGILLTSMNVNNKCVYKEILDNKINALIVFITGLENE